MYPHFRMAFRSANHTSVNYWSICSSNSASYVDRSQLIRYYSGLMVANKLIKRIALTLVQVLGA